MSLHHDMALARRDPALPGLPTLLNPDAFITALRRSMPEIGIEAARPVYVRYKPGMNCLVAYRLEGHGTEHRVYAKAHRRRDLTKLQKAREKPGMDTAFGPGCRVLEDLALVVSFFPNDLKLSVLRRLGDDATRLRLLRRVFPDRPALWTGTVQPLRYKPERRFVARLFAEGATGAALKFFTGSGYESADAGSRVFHPCGPLRLAARIGRSRRHRILAYEWLPGRLLSHALNEEAVPHAEVATVGAALAALHGQQPDRLPALTRSMETAALLAVAESLSVLCPPLAARARSLAARFAQILQSLPEVRVPIHGDFYAKQILLSGSTAAFLDFDRSVRGDPAADAGNFIAHLERDRLRGTLTAERVRQVRDALLEGYRHETTVPLPSDRIDFYTASGLFQLAPHPFRFREPDWPARTEAMLDRVEALLDALSPTRFSTPDHAVPVLDPFDAVRDPAMPCLPPALDPDEVRRQFAPLRPRLASNGGRLSLRSIRVLRHKPGRRCLIEYVFDARSEEASRRIALIGKVRAKGLDRRTYRLVDTLWRSGFHASSEDGISVPEPLGCVPAFRMWLQRKVPRTPATLVMTQADGLVWTCRIAEALHKLHRHGPLPKRRHTLDDELRILHERLSLTAQRHPRWTHRLDRVLHACERLAATLPDPAPGPIHRDFYADNVLIGEDRVYLLDFDLYGLGDPALDVGNFLGHLTEQSLRVTGDPEGFADREAALEETYIALHGASIRPAIRAYATLTLVRHIHLSTLFPDRRPFTERLLDLCEQRLLGSPSAMPRPPAFSMTARDSS
ncbi:MAG: phosphotransferase [Rhodothermales bacterium]